MEPMDRVVRAEWHLDFGGDGRLEAEYEKSHLWLALPVPLEAEVWMKGVGGSHDFRVRLTRTPYGFDIALDRGPGLGRAWPEGVPRLGVTLENSAGTGVVHVLGGQPERGVWQGSFSL